MLRLPAPLQPTLLIAAVGPTGRIHLSLRAPADFDDIRSARDDVGDSYNTQIEENKKHLQSYVYRIGGVRACR